MQGTCLCICCMEPEAKVISFLPFSGKAWLPALLPAQRKDWGLECCQLLPHGPYVTPLHPETELLPDWRGVAALLQ